MQYDSLSPEPRPQMARGNPISPSGLDVMGGMPMAELPRLTRATGGLIFAKLEHLNPGLSPKGWVAREMIETAEARGHLAPAQTVVEMASGNTGTDLVCVSVLKYLGTDLYPDHLPHG